MDRKKMTHTGSVLLWMLLTMSTLLIAFVTVQFSANKLLDIAYVRQEYTQRLESTNTLLSCGIGYAVDYFDVITGSTYTGYPVSLVFDEWSIGTSKFYVGTVLLQPHAGSVRITAHIADGSEILFSVSAVVIAEKQGDADEQSTVYKIIGWNSEAGAQAA